MALVKGDRIGESQRLTKCSVDAVRLYTTMIAAEVPDDFGRFRDSNIHVWVRMHPRLEPTKADLRRMRKLMEELLRAGLWRTWTVDGVNFAELYNHSPRGNMYHRTPEPPISFYLGQEEPHRHSRRCAKTALARAKEWGDVDSIPSLLLLVKKIDRTEAERTPNGPPKEARTDPDHPLPPFVPLPPTDTTSPLARAQSECTRELAATAAATGIPADELLPRASRPKGSASVITRIDTCDRVEWLDATRDRLIGIRLQAEESAPPAARHQATNDTLNFYEQHGWPQELGRKCAAYVRINPSMEPRAAMDKWLDIHAAPEHVRMEVLRRAFGELEDANVRRTADGGPAVSAQAERADSEVPRAARGVSGAAAGSGGGAGDAVRAEALQGRGGRS